MLTQGLTFFLFFSFLWQSDCFYNAGWTEDMREVVNFLHQRYPKAPLFTVGTSIGANILVCSYLILVLVQHLLLLLFNNLCLALTFCIYCLFR
jgi:alpha/beta superfamily hydrolase